MTSKPDAEFQQACEKTLLNMTQSFIELHEQNEELRGTVEILTAIAENSPDSKKVTLVGPTSELDDPLTTVRFILQQKLNLATSVVSAMKNSSQLITFEVVSLAEKLRILKRAQRILKNSRFHLY